MSYYDISLMSYALLPLGSLGRLHHFGSSEMNSSEKNYAGVKFLTLA